MFQELHKIMSVLVFCTDIQETGSYLLRI